MSLAHISEFAIIATTHTWSTAWEHSLLNSNAMLFAVLACLLYKPRSSEHFSVWLCSKQRGNVSGIHNTSYLSITSIHISATSAVSRFWWVLQAILLVYLFKFLFHLIANPWILALVWIVGMSLPVSSILISLWSSLIPVTRQQEISIPALLYCIWVSSYAGIELDWLDIIDQKNSEQYFSPRRSHDAAINLFEKR